MGNQSFDFFFRAKGEKEKDIKVLILFPDLVDSYCVFGVFPLLKF